MPSNTVLVSGPAVGAAQILNWSYACVFLPPMSTAIRIVCFLLREFSMTFYIFHRHRVCLVDHMDLIRSLYSWWEGFGSSSLATLPLGFNCGFISTSACGSSIGVCSWGCPGGLGFAPEPNLEVLGLPSEGQVWRRHSCLGGRGPGSTRNSGELVAREAGNMML